MHEPPFCKYCDGVRQECFANVTSTIFKVGLIFSIFFSICFDGVNKSALPIFSKGIPMKPMTELVKDRQPLIGQQHIFI